MRRRAAHIDALRGVAILTMVLDHVLVMVEPSHWLRYTVTRVSLPLFVAAAVWALRGPVSVRRAAALSGLVLAETVLNPVIGLAMPGPVLLILGTLVVVGTRWGRRWLPVLGVVGLIQALYLPVPWSGYQPGLVMAWAALGLPLAAAAGSWRTDWPEWLQAVGRRPGEWYVGHLAILAAVSGGVAAVAWLGVTVIGTAAVVLGWRRRPKMVARGVGLVLVVALSVPVVLTVTERQAAAFDSCGQITRTKQRAACQMVEGALTALGMANGGQLAADLARGWQANEYTFTYGVGKLASAIVNEYCAGGQWAVPSIFSGPAPFASEFHCVNAAATMAAGNMHLSALWTASVEAGEGEGGGGGGSWGSESEKARICGWVPWLADCTEETGEVPEGEFWTGWPVAPTTAGPLGEAVLTSYPVRPAPQWSALLAGTVPPDGVTIFRVAHPTNGRHLTISASHDTTWGRVEVTVHQRGAASVIGSVVVSNQSGVGSRDIPIAIALFHEAGSNEASIAVGNADGHSGWTTMGDSRWALDANSTRLLAESFLNVSAVSESYVYEFEESWGVQMWVGEQAPTQTALLERIGYLDPAISPGLPETDGDSPVEVPNPWDLPEAPPAVPVPWPTPSTPPELPPAPTIPEAPAPTPVPEGSGEEGLFDRLANRIGSGLHALGTTIGGLFNSLMGFMGDLLDSLIAFLREMLEWVVEALSVLLRWLGALLEKILQAIEALMGIVAAGLSAIRQVLFEILAVVRGVLEVLGSLAASIVEGVGNAIMAAVGSIVAAIQAVGQLILDLPGIIVDLLLSGLEALFVPSIEVDLLDECTSSFPCSWVLEGVDAGSALVGLIGGTGSCVTPSFSVPAAEMHDGFEASLPAPSGCGGGNGVDVDRDSGDLLGMREPLRALATVLLWLGVVNRLLSRLPWGRPEDGPLGAT